jgi:hypothetical protein
MQTLNLGGKWTLKQAGKPVEITLTWSATVSLEEIRRKLRVRSLYDTF